MTDAVSGFKLTIPGTITASPTYFIDCPLGWSEVTRIDMSFPAGCAGLVGARIEYSGNPVYPIGVDGWYVLDDYVMSIDVTNQKNGGQWRIAGYNQDFYPHSVTCYFSYNYVFGEQQSSSLVTL